MKTLEELRKKLSEAYDKMQALLDKADAEKRSLTKEETESYNTLDKEYDQLKADIAIREKQEQRAKEDKDNKEIVRRYVAPVPGVQQQSEQEKRDLNKYSFVRAIGLRLSEKPLDGIEREMHQEGTKQYRDAGLPSEGNLIIPQIVLARSGFGATERRNLTATGGSSGSEGGVMVQTSVGSIINRLQAKLMVGQMGATMLNGLVGNIDFPVFGAADAAATKAENAASDESSPTFTKKSISPNRLPVHSILSRQLLMQAENESVEAMVRNDLTYQIAKVMDLAGITDILGTVGIGSVVGGTDGAAPNWDDIVDLETEVAVDDADIGNLGYLTNPKVRGKLKKTFVDSSSNAERVWDIRSPDTPLNGYRAGVSTQVPSDLDKGSSVDVCSAIIFGNFADLLVAQWGGLEFLVNPYSLDTTGLIRLNAWTFFDTLVRRAQSFAAMKDALTA